MSVFITLLPLIQGKNYCPVANCHQKKAGRYVFLQESGPNYPLPYNAVSRQVNRPFKGKHGRMLYSLLLKPAEFICEACDDTTCPGCGVVCDIKKCFGEFFQQECWCQNEKDIKNETPLWTFNKMISQFQLDNSVSRVFCDEHCNAGSCRGKHMKCKKREEACKPWWWCNLPPPAHADSVEDDEKLWPKNEYESSFLQKKPKSFLQIKNVQQSKVPKLDNDIKNFHFKKGKWSCDAASLPPKIQDTQTLLWYNRGYIIFDAGSCSGESYDHVCYCWDNEAMKHGEDAHMTQKRCNGSCQLGQCKNKTCAHTPPSHTLKSDDDDDNRGDNAYIEKMGQKLLKSTEETMDEPTGWNTDPH